MNIGKWIEDCCPSVCRPMWERVRDSSLGYRIARGAFWSVSGQLVARFSALIVSVFLARLLGRKVFGEFGAIQNTVTMFQVFAGMAMATTAAKYIAQTRKNDPVRAGRIVCLVSVVSLLSGLVMALGVGFGADWVARDTLDSPQLAPAVRIAALVLVFGAMVGSQNGVLIGFEAFRTIAKTNVWYGCVALPLVVGGAWWGGLQGALGGMIAAFFANWIIVSRGVRKEAAHWSVPLDWRGCLREWPVLWSFSLPAILAELFYVPVTWACTSILMHQPGGAAENGLLYGANQWRLIVLFLPNTLGALAVPMLSNLRESGDINGMRKVFWTLLGLNSGIAVAAAAVLAIGSPWIMAVYGRDYSAGAAVLCVMAFATALMVAAGIVGNLLVSTGRIWTCLLLTAIWAAVTLGTAWQLRHQGAMGIALATLAGFAMHFVNSAFCAWRCLRTDTSFARKERPDGMGSD